ncbi:MAG: adenosine deaminase [Lachnospiraceae bacterium]
MEKSSEVNDMIDLHLHLDGSLSVETILRLAKEQQIELPANSAEELSPYLSVESDCRSLSKYLEKFDLPLSVMQTGWALQESVRSLMHDLQKKNMRYVEIRFAPCLHGQKGMSQQQACEAAIQGLSLGMEETEVQGQLILCCMRGQQENVNKETVRMAEKFLHCGVCALDLAGAEGLYPTENYGNIFALAREKGIPFTIHAGEAAGAESVWTAVKMGASRIGHGIRAQEDEKLVNDLAKHHIALETCPSSNVQTQAVSTLKVHPILNYLKQGMLVTVNTDNMTVSHTDIWQEYRLLEAELGLTATQKQQLLKNAVEAAFLSAEEKKKLLHSCRIE